MKRILFTLFALLLMLVFASLTPVFAQDTPVATQETAVTAEPLETQQVIVVVTPTPGNDATPVPEPTTAPPVIILPPPADDGSINFGYIFGSIALILLAFQTWRSQGKFKAEEVQAIIDRERAHAATTATPIDNVVVDIIEAVANVLLRFQGGQSVVAQQAVPAVGNLSDIENAPTSLLVAILSRRNLTVNPIALDAPATGEIG